MLAHITWFVAYARAATSVASQYSTPSDFRHVRLHVVSPLMILEWLRVCRSPQAHALQVDSMSPNSAATSPRSSRADRRALLFDPPLTVTQFGIGTDGTATSSFNLNVNIRVHDRQEILRGSQDCPRPPYRRDVACNSFSSFRCHMVAPTYESHIHPHQRPRQCCSRSECRRRVNFLSLNA